MSRRLCLLVIRGPAACHNWDLERAQKHCANANLFCGLERIFMTQRTVEYIYVGLATRITGRDLWALYGFLRKTKVSQEHVLFWFVELHLIKIPHRT